MTPAEGNFKSRWLLFDLGSPLRMLRTKIVCTLGPATSEAAVVLDLVQGGMDVARLNMAHGDHATHRKMVDSVRAAAIRVDRPIAVLADLRGPKIRVGPLAAPTEIPPGGQVVMAFADHARPGQIPITYEGLARDLGEGDRVLIDDGLIELECVRVDGQEVTFRAPRGGAVRRNQGVNIPSGALSASSLTSKDLADLEFAMEMGVEYIGMSFVRTASDVDTLKEHVAGRALIVAKIEMARALDAIDEILEASDMVMIARGDLGVELPFEQVPLAQKKIIQKANYHGRPVITATQMLESMIEHSRPTRAEVSDVANAILDGTDAVMLSGETAIGKHPASAPWTPSSILRHPR